MPRKCHFTGNPKLEAEALLDAKLMGFEKAAEKWSCSPRKLKQLKKDFMDALEDDEQPLDREQMVTEMYRELRGRASSSAQVVDKCNELLLENDGALLKALAALPEGKGAETLSKISHNAARVVEVAIPKQNVTAKRESQYGPGQWAPPPPPPPLDTGDESGYRTVDAPPGTGVQ